MLPFVGVGIVLEKGVVGGDIDDIVCTALIENVLGVFIVQDWSGHILPSQTAIVITIGSDTSDNCSDYRYQSQKNMLSIVFIH